MRKRNLDIRLRAAGVCCFVLCVATTRDVSAQGPRDGSPAIAGAAITRTSRGLAEVAGELWGMGADYKMRFGHDGVEFTPALGSAAPRNLPLRLTVTSMGRDTARSAAPEAVRTRDGYTVRYARPTFDEVYEVRADGVEQSFVFRELPRGRGDLVIRLAATTDLPLAHRAPDEVRFERDGLGGVRIGAVTGIDARGDRVAGALDFRSGALEISLPASFVDRAALPLVVDPLITTVLPVSSGHADIDPDAAYEETEDVYLVVWTLHFSSGDRDIVGQLVRGDGTLTGGMIAIRMPIAPERPRVAVVTRRDAFVVVWEEDYYFLTPLPPRVARSVLAATVNAKTATVSAPVFIEAGSTSLSFPSRPDVAGEHHSADDAAIVVWHRSLIGSQTIRAVRVLVTPSGMPQVGTPIDVVTPGPWTLGRPAISDNAGAAGRHLVVWSRDAGIASHSIWGAVLDRGPIVMVPPLAVSSVTWGQFGPVVAGDGTSWTCAFTRRDGFGEIDVHCRTLTLDPRSGRPYLSREYVVAGDPGESEVANAIVRLSGSCIVVVGRDISNEVLAMSVDPFDCGTCEPTLSLELEPGLSHQAHIAPRLRRGPSGNVQADEAMIVWDSHGRFFVPTAVRFALFRGDDGLVTDLGGGCGGGGRATATCAITGNPGFALRVQHAVPMSPTLLVLSAQRLDAPCGGCVLVPNPFAGFVLSAGSTDSHGDAAMSLPIPPSAAMVGATFLQQWIVDGGSACETQDLSNALRVQIQ